MVFSDSGPQYSGATQIFKHNAVVFCSLSTVSAAIRTLKGQVEYELKVKFKKEKRSNLRARVSLSQMQRLCWSFLSGHYKVNIKSDLPFSFSWSGWPSHSEGLFVYTLCMWRLQGESERGRARGRKKSIYYV